MDSLTFIGIVAAFVAGAGFGAAVMYFGRLIIEWEVDRQFKEQEEDMRQQKTTAPEERPCGTCPHYVDFKLTDRDSIKACEKLTCIYDERQEEKR